MDHRLEHLGRRDGDHTRAVGLLQDPLLQHRDPLERHFDPEVSARHHHAVGRMQDLGEPLHGAAHLELGDERNASPPPSQQAPNALHIPGGAHERQRQVVDPLPQSELQVGAVL